MTVAPNSPLLDRVALAIRNAAENPSDIRSGTLWFLSGRRDQPFEESDYLWLADNALAACRAEEMRAILKRLTAPYTGNPDDEPLDAIINDADALLAKLDAQP